ncbi:MAG: adenylosuccinate synthetase [Deltaproteobacteria bacterium]|nr:adenylosuccinate synthetase [Deltaproteobacteria bacterium]
MSGRRVEVVLGLGFGDEGKGATVDWLARRARSAPLIIRWNGGPQAAHHVVTSDGRTHCFAQLGAGMFVDGARTHLGPEMAIDPFALVAEARAIAEVGVADALRSVTIDPRAILVTPWHAIVNQVRELARGGERHGTTGRGVAEAKLGAIAVRAGAIGDGLRAAIEPLRAALIAKAEQLAGDSEPARALAARAHRGDLTAAFFDATLAMRDARVTAEVPAADHVILEAAQGALLDRDHGFFPHVTPSRITRAAAEDALGAMAIAPAALEVWGVLRAVHTRHGEGPLPSEDAALTAALPEAHNPDDGWAGRFRVGWFDAVLARYALGVAGPIDRLAITCLDRVSSVEGPAIVDAWQHGAVRIADLGTVPASERTRIAFAATPERRAVDDIGAAIAQAMGRRIELAAWGMTAADRTPG